jgi:PAS domain S-box-containing protein
MEQARDSGQPVASGKVTLVQEIDESLQPGFLIYVPTYRGGEIPETVEGRRQNLLGFIYSPFRADDLFAGIFGGADPKLVEFEVFDGDSSSAPTRIFQSDHLARARPNAPAPRFERTASLTVAGRLWTLRLSSGSYLERTSGRTMIPFMAGSGILVSLVLFATARSQARAHALAELHFRSAQAELAERKRAEVALRHSREQLQLVTDALPVLVSYIDCDHRYRFNNRTYESWFGLAPEAVSGRTMSEVLGAAAYSRLLPYVDQALKGRNVTFEAWVPYEHGSRYIQASYIPHLRPDGQAAGFVVLVSDITQRKKDEDAARFLAQAGDALSQSLDYEETLSSVARLAVPSIADWCDIDMLTPGGTIERLILVHSDPAKVSAAQVLRERYPLDPNSPHGIPKVIRTGTAELVPVISDAILSEVALGPEHLRLIQALGLKSAMLVPIKARGRIYGAISFALSESDRCFTVEDLGVAEELAVRVGLAVDNALLYRAAQQEIAERELAARALRESEERFRLMVERAQDIAIFMLDRQARISSWNPGAQRILGHEESEVLGQPGDIIFTQTDRDHGIPEEEIRIALETGQALSERWHVRRDGSRFWASGAMIALRDENLELRGFARIMRDVTERKRAEEAIQRLNEELERRVERRTASLRDSHEQLEAFTYTVAHDLRAPLRAMQGFSQALIEDYRSQLDGTAMDYLGRIVTASQRMDALIQDLLAYSRISRTELTFEPVSLERTMERIRPIFAEEIGAKGATLEIRSPLPEVYGHSATVEHILTNLIGNALKFVAPGTAPHVSVWADRRAGRVRVWVEDNGIGIAPQYQERIFKDFERLHGPDHYPGTGIGLAIVRKGIERMNGTAGLESDERKGSRFWFELSEVR